MSRNKKLHSHLVRMLIIPFTIAFTVIFAIWFYAYHQIQQNNLQAHFSLLNSFFHNVNTLSPPKLRNLADAILSVNGHRSVILLNASGQTIERYGAPIASTPSNQAENIARLDHLIFYTFKLTAPSNTTIGQQAAYAIVVAEDFQSKLLFLKTTLFTFIAALVGFFVLLNLSRRFEHALGESIDKIQVSLSDFIKGNPPSSSPAEHDTFFNELPRLIATCIAAQRSGQEDIQKIIDQSTQEYRESLESVEIQNIELDIARKNAVQANQNKSEFIANTSHEIKLPINGILANIELLLASKLKSQQLQQLQSVHEYTSELNTTINDILDYSGLESGKLTLEHKPVNIRTILEEGLHQQAAAACRKNIELLHIVDHDIPENLLGDPRRIQQVLQNLLSNAIKYTPEGYVLVSVGSEGIGEDKFTLKFKIADSGIGLSESQQDTLFDQFSLMESTYNQPRGTAGLGLIIAKGLVDRMDGQIGVESQQGKGATFWFTANFPLNLAVKNTPTRKNQFLGKIATDIFLPNNTMLKMELLHYLGAWGCEISEFTEFSAAEAERLPDHTGDRKKHLFIIDYSVICKQVQREHLHKNILKLSQKDSIHIVLLYKTLDKKLFQEDKFQDIVQLEKPLSYQHLHTIFCDALGLEQEQLTSKQQAIKNTPNKTSRILAVDDNPANLKLLFELFKDKGLTIETADSGEDALTTIQSTRYDLILMDINMPEMDGLETTQKIRELESNGQRTPIIALTAHGEAEKKISILSKGLDDFLCKPVDGNNIDKVLNRWLPDNQAPTHASEKSTPVVRFSQANATKATENTSPVDINLSLKRAQKKTDLAFDMLTMLINSLPEAKSQLKQSWEDGNIDTLQEIAHKLHGGSCYCGIPDFTQACADVERELEENNPSVLGEKLNRLFKHINELESWAEQTNIETIFTPEHC